MFNGSFSDRSPKLTMSLGPGKQPLHAALQSRSFFPCVGRILKPQLPDNCPFLLFFSSPFKIKVLPAHDASKVRASGPGLNASGIPASLPVEFTIDARDAGEGLLTVQILVSLGTAPCPARLCGHGQA